MSREDIRQALKDRIIDLGCEARDDREFFIASVLMTLAAAIVSDTDDGLAKTALDFGNTHFPQDPAPRSLYVEPGSL